MAEQKRLVVSPSLVAFLQTAFRYYEKRPPSDEVMGVYEDALRGHGNIHELEAAFRQWVTDTTHDHPPRAADLLMLLRARKSGEEAGRKRETPPELTPEEFAENRIRAAMAAVLMGLPLSKCGLRLEGWEIEFLEGLGSTAKAMGVAPHAFKGAADQAVIEWRRSKRERAERGYAVPQSDNHDRGEI